MDKEFIMNAIYDFTDQSPLNYVQKEMALSEDIIGMRLYEHPLIAFGSANDACFEKLKEPGVVGTHFRLPGEWLNGAKTVVSIWFPFCDFVKKSNAVSGKWPSDGWLHARYEGQEMIKACCLHLKALVEEQGYSCVSPSFTKEFSSKSPTTDDNTKQDYYTSNWSERHVAHVCGHGTFGLSKGLITEKGIAGRIGSVIIDKEMEPTEREYQDVYEYCTMCGACVRRCPVGAISLENGKIHSICSAFLDETLEKNKPRYGCGKCQVNVPCESCIPGKGKGA